MYCSGSAEGNDDPTVLFMARESITEGYTSEYLICSGAALGSSVQMTPKGFATDKSMARDDSNINRRILNVQCHLFETTQTGVCSRNL